jgi:outer membrane protein assembly factor BamE (lipoprotein component of BamABCDE complex)
MLVSSSDILAGMALIGAALCAEGISEVNNIQMIHRGYERIEEKLQSLSPGCTHHRISEILLRPYFRDDEDSGETVRRPCGRQASCLHCDQVWRGVKV